MTNEMKDNQLIIGSRASKLALTQARLMKDGLEKAHSGLKVVIKTIKTTGDKILDAPLNKIGSKGLFTKEIEEALLEKKIDCAVHSIKDLPIEIPDRLKIACITKREKANDVLVSSKGCDLKALPENSKVGTSSLRRQAQVLNMRRDLNILNLRGNLDTRIRKLQDGLFDAIILAYAGIKRLGLKLNMSVISIGDMLPQAGQGALGIEIRKDDTKTYEKINMLNDGTSYTCIEAERALLSSLGGGCQVPIGVYAEIKNQQLDIQAGVFSLDGKIAIKDTVSGSRNNPSAAGEQLADKLLKKGAKEILCQSQQSI